MMWGMPVRNKWRKESNPARENQIPVMIMGQRKASQTNMKGMYWAVEGNEAGGA